VETRLAETPELVQTTPGELRDVLEAARGGRCGALGDRYPAKRGRGGAAAALTSC
jgi:hypothetical protein